MKLDSFKLLVCCGMFTVFLSCGHNNNQSEGAQAAMKIFRLRHCKALLQLPIQAAVPQIQ